jgi:hypothetical protein
LLARDEARHDACRAAYEIIHPHEARPSRGQRVIDGIAMTVEKPHPNGTRALLQERGCAALALIAFRLARQLIEQARRPAPIARKRVAIGGKIGGLSGLRLLPLPHVASRQAGRGKAFHHR